MPSFFMEFCHLLTLECLNVIMLEKEVKKIKTLTIRLEDDLHKRLKLYSVKKDETIQDMVVRLICEELEKAEKEK